MSITVPKFFKKWDTLFFILLALISYLYSYQTILFLRPCSIHQWRQCDCLSITLNYYKEGMHFFSPSVHLCILPRNSGKTCTSECPLLYYLVAFLWKIFGYHEFIYRLLDVTLAFAGLYSLFKLTKEILQDGAWALFVSLLLFTSPIFAVYANNFLTDVPALSFGLIAWYFFVRYYKTKRLRSFYIFILFFLLAGLTKITALFSFIPLIVIFLWELFNRNKSNNKIFIKPLIQGLAILFLLVLISSWTAYSIHYNNINSGGVFSTTIMPITGLTSAEIHTILVKFYNNLLPQFFSFPLIFLSMALFFTILINYRKVNPFYYWVSIILFIGCILYFLLWYQVFNVHDYYLVNLLIFIPSIFITFLLFLKENYRTIFQSVKVKIVCATILIFNIYYCYVQVNTRYAPTIHLVKNSFILNEETARFWIWGLGEYETHMKTLETITPYLRSLGISRNDTVVSMPDGSPNISLYLMDVKGYTDYGYGELKDSARIEHFISLGARYLIINDPAMLENIWLKPYLKNKIGTYKNITIYNLRGL